MFKNRSKQRWRPTEGSIERQQQNIQQYKENNKKKFAAIKRQVIFGFFL